ncbi:MAG: 50S ribosomal protein L21 [Flavobacteriales bacterium]|nr:50S ribosomal protein L21 [Flavobacteriales bacterium]|tara:strand:- start:27270 stop:27785 length:516 start_codon:yes stop_codon:yes gene_type:complete
MYAIVEIAGQQFKVEKDQELFVHRLEGKEGSKVNFDNVLMTVDGSKIEVGAPAVKGVSVSAKIVEHLKGDKVIVFKKKRRKGYKVKNGHRQYLSKIQIESIGASKGTAKKAEPKAEETKAEAKPKAEKAAPKASTEKKAETAKKETKPKAEKKPAAKKPAAKKEATKKEDK